MIACIWRQQTKFLFTECFWGELEPCTRCYWLLFARIHFGRLWPGWKTGSWGSQLPGRAGLEPGLSWAVWARGFVDVYSIMLCFGNRENWLSVLYWLIPESMCVFLLLFVTIISFCTCGHTVSMIYPTIHLWKKATLLHLGVLGVFLTMRSWNNYFSDLVAATTTSLSLVSLNSCFAFQNWLQLVFGDWEEWVRCLCQPLQPPAGGLSMFSWHLWRVGGLQHNSVVS